MHAYNIGIPKPFPALAAANYALSENCLGLMYHRHDFHPDNVIPYITAYFSQFAFKLKPNSALPIIILAIKIEEALQTALSEAAAFYGITIKHVDRLQQADFIHVLKKIGERGGIASFDGTQSVMQAAYVETQFHVYFHENHNANKALYQEMIDAIPTELQATGKAILSLTTNYSPLKNIDRYNRTQRHFQSLFKSSVAHFEAHQAKIPEEKSDDVVIDYDFIAADAYVRRLRMLVGNDPQNKPLIKRSETGNQVAFPRFWLKQLESHHQSKQPLIDIAQNLNVSLMKLTSR
jgi:hypothetical protein